ncbi:MAG TPA: group II intron maturase-specific domain-containing protein [Thermoanaerobaculia bacterium]|nr:group II intron maturase-specific domain-containing protein [Thermoanaerobaculia bacterium]
MFRALRRVLQNKGAPGVDGMTVGELPGYLRTHWPEIRAALLNGSYRPQPVLRKEIPKPGGGVRELGIPTVLDRLIQQALARLSIFVRSQRAGERVLASVTSFLKRRLKLRVNLEKSAVDRPWRRVLLGFTFVGREFRRRVSDKALKALRLTVKQKTRRTLGVSFRSLLSGLSKTLLGWRSYYRFSEVPSPLQEVEKWIRRRLRCYLWKQWGRRGYRELKRRGVSVDLAWNTSKSAHGSWRLSQSPALTIALPARYFRRLGLPSLVNG